MLVIRPTFQRVRTSLHSLTVASLHAVTLAFGINLRTKMGVLPKAAHPALVYSIQFDWTCLFSIESFGVSEYHLGIAASHHRQIYPPSCNSKEILYCYFPKCTTLNYYNGFKQGLLICATWVNEVNKGSYATINNIYNATIPYYKWWTL